MILINRERVLKLIGERVIRSVNKNFREGGRPDKWKQSKRAQLKHRSKKDKKLREGKTLIDTGMLMRSIHYEVIGTNEVEVGTNIDYAKIHNEGGKITKTEPVKSHKRTITSSKGTRDITVKAHSRSISITIPERRFLLIQKDDEQYFKKILDREIKEGIE
jgi:phage gpG-like protein